MEPIIYQDELNDEFSKAKISPIIIDGSYKYFKDTFFYKLSSFIYYRLIAFPIAFIYSKLKFHISYINKSHFKAAKNTGAFIYGNHTQAILDAINPTLMSTPKKVYIITHPNNVSINGLKAAAPRLGAIPLPDDLNATRNFIRTIDKRIKEKALITIYPEAHIWPYYTKIRPFTSASFNYPIKYNVPAYSFTNVYLKSRFSSKPIIKTYIDGPFYPNKDLPRNEQAKDLRDRIYFVMNCRASLSNYEYVNYVKRECVYD